MIDGTHPLSSTRPNHVWAMGITYLPRALGFVYLAAVMDWASRRLTIYNTRRPHDSLGRVRPRTFLPRPPAPLEAG